MLKFNISIFYLGILLTAIGVVIGLPALMYFDHQSLGIIFLLNIAPFGFLLWFTGFVGYTLSRPNNDRQAHLESDQYQRQVPD